MSLTTNFIHQKQPTDKTCTATCIAMILGIDVKTVIEEFQEGYHDDTLRPDGYLKKKNTELRIRCGYSYEEIRFGTVYILVVPSLHIEATMHSVLVDTRQCEITVLDPNQGRKGKKYYVWDIPKDRLKPNEVELKGHCVDYEIIETVKGVEEQTPKVNKEKEV